MLNFNVKSQTEKVFSNKYSLILKILTVILVPFIFLNINTAVIFAGVYASEGEILVSEEEIEIEIEEIETETEIQDIDEETQRAADAFLELIQENSEDEVIEFITTAALNFRSGPSADHSRISLLPSGTVIVVTEHVPGGFSRIEHDGQVGYVSSDYIRIRTDYDIILPSGGSANNSQGVELLSWSEVKQILPLHTNILVTDVRTGLTYTVRNFSNGNHADVEPATATDTATLRQAFGGRWSWDPRPVIVNINGRLIAAAINGMPHGGTTISGNNFGGHICLHFLGARTHNGNRTAERLMQAAVQEAFNSR
ncbi:MAG: SH3 domain-containing protein [Defluviitaleaceae bacterium]|nr:SH3 domain-containing protein [Defluviitaleaceae bacterium]